MAPVSVDREISTPRPSAPRDISPRIYLKLASDTLRGGRFETYADLIDAVKTACARARVPYDGPCISEAVRTIAIQRGGVLVKATRAERHERTSFEWSATTVKDIYERLNENLPGVPMPRGMR